MDLEKIFHDLESNQSGGECEEAKRKLAEYFSQNKEQWVVQFMMEYFLKTGSFRICEVLIKVQPPHDNFIFDRLAEWLKLPTHRLSAINLFSFIIRKHPTWLYKVEKHRLIKDIFKLLQTEKEIVPLMSALLCIIMLLPIIPNSVPNFFNDLFEVFGYLASWNCENPNGLTDDKLLHLQLGLQMLFHRLYGMYPCNFMAFLSEFIKKDKGAIYIHTIKPLLETVRVHPLLLTATANSELNSMRWKEMEPHDVVVECASVTLPVLHQDQDSETNYSNSAMYVISAPEMPKYSLPKMSHTFTQYTTQTVSWSGSPMHRPHKNSHPKESFEITRFENERRRNFDDRQPGAQIAIWSPYNEFANNTGPIPLTPNPPYMLSMPSPANVGNVTHQMAGLTGSSPPEAAVEATPETTPLKDVSKDLSQGQGGKGITNKLGGNMKSSNPNAVRAIFVSSQPSSPMRKEQNHFHFPEAETIKSTMIFADQDIVTRGTTNFDKSFQKIVEERNHTQSTFQTIELQAEAVRRRGRNSIETIAKSETPDIECEALTNRLKDMNSIQSNTPNQTHAHTPMPLENITKTCAECNETDHSMCTAGGLHSVSKILNKLTRRHRMASYSYNNSSCEKSSDNCQSIYADVICATAKVRRTKSCSSISSSLTLVPIDWNDIKPSKVDNKHQERRLHKNGKMLAIPSKISTDVKRASIACQTIDVFPQNYEISLFNLLTEHRDLYRKYECKLLNPQQILDHFIMNSIVQKSSRHDQDQFQLICLQLQYERYRREIHAERNRRLMGRSRIKRNLEMERDTLKEQLKSSVANIEKKIVREIDATQKAANERESLYLEELTAIKSKYQSEVEQSKRLRLENEHLQTQLKEQQTSRKEINYELEVLRGQIFDLTSELKQAQVQIDIGLQCKQELARLEAEFIIMGEVQVKCKDQLSEMENIKTKGEDELQMIQDTCNKELKKVKHELEDKTSHLDSAKHKIIDLQAQLMNCEKVITDQKRLLKTVKDEYEERFKALNKKYETQKIILMQMEEKITSLQRPPLGMAANACSPDPDKTDVASSVEKNSSLSTSLASSESLSTSLRSTEMRNLQQLAEAGPDSTCPPLEVDRPSTTATSTSTSLNQRR